MELVLLYWWIEKEILLRQEEQGWGAKIIDQTAKDLLTHLRQFLIEPGVGFAFVGSQVVIIDFRDDAVQAPSHDQALRGDP